MKLYKNPIYVTNTSQTFQISVLDHNVVADVILASTWSASGLTPTLIPEKCLPLTRCGTEIL